MTYYDNTRQAILVNRHKDINLDGLCVTALQLLGTGDTIETVLNFLNERLERHYVTAPNQTGYATSTEN